MLLPLLLAAQVTAAPSPTAAAQTSELRLLRSLSGTRGTQVGSRFEVDDPRTVFTVPEDRQLLVYFEWEGAPGQYALEGRWKDPSGAVVLSSPLEYQARARRFGVYWSLGLPATAASGLWALEVHLGGRAVGTHAFEVRGGLSAASSLPPGVLYEKARHSVALVEGVGASGEVTARGVVTALDPDLVVGPFHVVDGSHALRITLPDGKRREFQEVGAWNRREGWAVLRVPAHGLTVLPPAAAPAPVGSRTFVIGAQEDGGRTIEEAEVKGEAALPAGRRAPRLGSGFPVGSAALTGRGELLGVVVGGQDAPEGRLALMSIDRAITPHGSILLSRSLLPAAPGATIVSLGQLAASGAFMRHLSPDRRHVISGVFAARVHRGGVVPMPTDQRDTYSRREQTVSVFIQWNPQEKRETTGTFEVYDPDNRPLVKSEPTKLKLKPNELFFSTWTFRIEQLPPETYRVDLSLEGAPVWRGWVRVTE